MKQLLTLLLATIALAAAASAQASPPVPYGNNPGAGKFYDIRGFKMYCEEYGAGTPLLMIHGNGGSIRAFAHNIPYFAAKYRVIAADSRAQGKSKDPGPELTFEMMADDEAALLDALHVKAAYVIGWSDGGIVALALAMRHPDKVIKLAATGANVQPDASAFAPGLWDHDKKRYDADKNKTWKTDAERNKWKLFMLDWDQPNIPFDALHAISCPSLIICGDHDLISIEHTVKIFQNIPHAELWVVPNSGHGTLIQHADEFNRTVDEFFSSPTAGASRR
ncbi:MAG TPA: alpha/beta hydrolase [Verrucomicrobiae bacterium]|jgi:pimeloyl-ACP methyl ester carboxylesterase|nr:alpha/beta hydrolase [Verrucomicrobiae bacterium]